MHLMTDRQREVLERQDVETLCQWYCLLNTWRWPKGLPDDPYRGLPSDERIRVECANKDPLGKTGIVMLWLVDRIGEKEIARYWNTKFLVGRVRKTEAEFERWWKQEEQRDMYGWH